MMPVIRISDDLFRRLQKLATPLVDTPASVIERLLDLHPRQTSSPVPVEEDTETDASAATVTHETYENRNNPHVTIHTTGCSQLRKRGGIHRHGQGRYKGHDTLASAESYAKQTGLPIKFCRYCNPGGAH